jgi:hypothetical protein
MVTERCYCGLRMMATRHEALPKRSGPQPFLFAVHGAAAVVDSGRGRSLQLSREKNLFQKKRFPSAAAFL